MTTSITLPESFWAQVDNFTTLLLKYNQTHNITGAKTKEAVLKNVEDSIYPLNFLDISSLALSINPHVLMTTTSPFSS